MNKEIKIHESNMILFSQRIAELNQKFQKKGLPEIKTRIIKEPLIENGDEIYEVELSSDFDQTNLKGIEVNFEGVVSLVDLNERFFQGFIFLWGYKTFIRGYKTFI